MRLLREAVRKNLPDLVTHGTITGGGRVRIPIKAIRQWRLEFDTEQQEQTGSFSPSQDSGGSGQPQPGGRPKKGDVLGHRPKQGQGQGQGGAGGDGGGEATYDVEIGVEAVAEELFTDMELPRLQHKQQAEQFTEEWRMEDIRKRGSMSNLDKRRTVVENIVRNAARGEARFGELADADLRFRTPEIRRTPQDKVAALFVRDRSGSMGEQEKYLTRVMAFWITRFLAFKYRKSVETAFVLFDTEAVEATEEEFFHRSEGGGTAVSTGFRLADQIIHERYSPDRYNLYLFTFSDGDNPSSDNPEVESLASKLAAVCNLIGYADIKPRSHGSEWSSVALALQGLACPHLLTVNIRNQEDVLTALRGLFRKQ